MPKKEEKLPCFLVRDGFEDETSKAIVGVLNKCSFRKDIKKVILKKYGKGIHLQIRFIPGKKHLIIADEIRTDDPDRLLHELRCMCK